MSDQGFFNVSTSSYPSQLQCSPNIIGSTGLFKVFGVGVSPVYEDNWHLITQCCPEKQVSVISSGSLTASGGKVSYGCQAWCFTTPDKLFDMKNCYGNDIFTFVDCQSDGTDGCSKKLPAPSSSQPTLSATSTLSTSTSRGLAAPTQIKKAAGVLVLILSIMATAAEV